MSLAALVTGGSRGIGRAIAMQLAQRGVRIAIHYRNNQDTAEATLADLPGTAHSLFDADLADPAATTQLWQRVVKQLGAATAPAICELRRMSWAETSTSSTAVT